RCASTSPTGAARHRASEHRVWIRGSARREAEDSAVARRGEPTRRSARIPAWSGDRAGVEQDQVVDDAPVLGPGFASAGDIQDAFEQFLAQVLDAGFAGGDPAGVDV